MRRLLAILWIFLLAMPAAATTYTVKAGGGGNYTTVGGCAAVAVAGDNCVIYAGTYNETVSPANSGSSGNPITYSTNPGDNVTITAFNLASLSYITIKGTSANNLTITNQISWAAITHSIFQYITDTSGTATGSCFGGNGWYSSGNPTSYNQFLNLTVEYCGGTTNNATGAIEFEGHYNLVDSLTCSNQQACVTLSGTYNVIRNSTFGPTSTGVVGTNHSQPVEASVSCPGGGGSDIPGGLQHLLYEDNTSSQWRGGNSHGIILNTDTGPTDGCGSTANVLRLSATMDSGSYGTEIYDSLITYGYNLSFSNTQLDNSPKDLEDWQFYPGSNNSRSINNIFSNMTRPATTDWCIYADGTPIENHNLCFMTGYSGSWNGPTTASSNTYDASDIFNSDPKYVNADTNLNLQAGSPAIAAGGPLTTASGSGVSSTALTVGDAGFFFANAGMPGSYAADWIRIGASTTVQISSINYSTNVLTLATAVSWNNGDGIYLYKDSSGNVQLPSGSPNLGAYPVTNSSPIQYLREGHTDTFASSSIAVSLLVGTGDTVTAFVGHSAGTIASVTCGSNSLVQQATAVNGSAGTMEAWTVLSASACSTVTATLSTGTANMTMGVEVWNTVLAIGNTGTANGGGAISVSLTTQDNNNYMAFGMLANGTTGGAVSSGTVVTSQYNHNDSEFLTDGYIASSTPASVAFASTNPNTTSWAAVGVELRSGGTPPTLSSIAVTPTDTQIAVGGQTEQLTATGTYSDSSTADVTSASTWTSSSPSVATVSSGGLVTSVALGNTTIEAAISAVNGNTGVKVALVSYDSFGGVVQAPCRVQLSTWNMQKRGNHWVFCTPPANGYLSNSFIMRSVYYILGSEGDPGTNSTYVPTSNSSTISAKYTSGNVDDLDYARLLTWGFNAGAPGAYKHATDSTIAANHKVPFTEYFENGYANDPVYACQVTGQCKNIWNLTGAPYDSTKTVVDAYDSGLPAIAASAYAADTDMATFAASPYYIGFVAGDTDDHAGFSGACPTAPNHPWDTDPTGSCWGSIGPLFVKSAPRQMVNPKDGWAPFTSTTNASKAALVTFLTAEYGTIGALNTAWSCSYTTFGTAGTAVTGATMSGSGAGPYTASLSAHIDPFSVLILVSGAGVAGDDGHGAIDVWGGSGLTISAYSLNYSTGAVSITFSGTPAASPTINYYYAGWGYGTGLLDEAGSACIGNGDNTGTSAQIADLDNFLQAYTTKLFGVLKTAFLTVAPNKLFFGLTNLGQVPGRDPARCSILAGMAAVADVTQVSTDGSSAQMNFIATCVGDKPFANWESIPAEADSQWYACPAAGPCSGAPTPWPPSFNQTTQATRAVKYGSDMSNFWNNCDTTTNVCGWVGFSWWAMNDSSFYENYNFGLTTWRDNALDGNENVTGSVSCSAPEAALMCGGEQSGWSAYGNFLGPVTITNIALDENIVAAFSNPLSAPVKSGLLLARSASGTLK